ncbi:MAG: beta-galactosidase domain 4-containing protein, partial [Promethearchaeota archaeon]
WELTANGKIIQEGKLPKLAIDPGVKQDVEIPFEEPELQPNTEYHLIIKFSLAEDTLWAEKGYIIAWDQFEIPFDIPKTKKEVEKPLNEIKIDESTYKIIIQGTNFTLTVDKHIGAIISFIFDGKELISSPLIPNFWRAPTDNDIGIAFWIPFFWRFKKKWKKANQKRKVIRVETDQIDSSLVRIIIISKVPYGRSKYISIYDIFGNGDTIIKNIFKPGKDMIRFGMQMTIPKQYNNVSWFGRGPHENYIDRKTGAAIGIYSYQVDELIHNYVKPQENGNRTDVRWVSFLDNEGSGLLVIAVGDSLLNFSAWPYKMQDLERAKHIHELPRRDTITVNIDYGQRGVGGYVPAFLWLDKEFKLLKGKSYNYSFRLRPIKKE